MSKVDDELTRRLQRAERPMDGDGLFDGLVARRSHRERLRRVQAGLVAFAVLTATAGGFAILRDAFDTGGGTGVTPSPGVLAANGEIIFAKAGGDARLHIYAAQPDGSGERQITDGPTNDSSPAVSPDGRTVAFVRIVDESTQRIAIVGIDGGEVTHVTPEYDRRAVDPAWSPSGTTLAYVTTGIDSQQLATIEIEQKQTRYLVDFFGQLASPTWSPDGTRIALSVGSAGSQSVGIIPTNTMMERPLEESLGVGSAPAWSPDGSTVALIRPGDVGDEIWTIAPDGSSEKLIATRIEGSLQPDLAWAPDGAALLVSDGDWIYAVDATPEGDPRENFVRLMQGQSPSWQPLPADSDPSSTVTPEPSTSPEPDPAGRDVGIGFNLCSIDRLGGIDWFGDGTDGTAWTGTRVDDRGRCGREDIDSVIAADLDGDGSADAWSSIDECINCEPWAATDLDGNGTEELVVLLLADIHPTFAFFFAVPDGLPRSSGILPIFLEGPGVPELGLRQEGLVTVQGGAGEEGISASAIRCEGYPGDPLLVVAKWIKDESTGAIAYYGARLRLETSDDLVDSHFVMAETFTPGATSEDFGGDGDACGVDFNPWN